MLRSILNDGSLNVVRERLAFNIVTSLELTSQRDGL